MSVDAMSDMELEVLRAVAQNAFNKGIFEEFEAGEILGAIARLDAAERERDELRAAQGWRAIDSAPDDELFIAAIEVNTVNGPVYWQMDIVYIDDETGDIALDCEAGWRLQDYSHWQPLPSPPTR